MLLFAPGSPYIYYKDRESRLRVASINTCDGSTRDVLVTPVVITEIARYNMYLVTHEGQLYSLYVHSEVNGENISLANISSSSPVYMINMTIIDGEVHMRDPNYNDYTMRVRGIVCTLETDDNGRIGIFHVYRSWNTTIYYIIVWIHVAIGAVSIEHIDNNVLNDIHLDLSDTIYIMHYDRILKHHYVISADRHETAHMITRNLTPSVTFVNIFVSRDRPMSVHDIKKLTFVVWHQLLIVHYVNAEDGYEIMFNIRSCDVRPVGVNMRRSDRHFACINDSTRIRGGYSVSPIGTTVYDLSYLNLIDGSICTVYIDIDIDIAATQSILGCFTCG